MGCRESKIGANGTNKRRRKSDISIFCPLPVEADVNSPPPIPTEIDPRSPLDIREIFRIKQSWKGIRRNMEQTGVEMFINLFRSDSDILNLFRGFRNLHDDDEMRESESLEAHAMLVMNTLDEAIINLDKFDFVFESLKATGAIHSRFPGFKEKYFRYMEKPFLNAIRLTLGDRYSDRVAKLYEISIDFILSTLQQGMREALENGRPIKSTTPRENTNTKSNHVSAPSPDAPPPAITVNS